MNRFFLFLLSLLLISLSYSEESPRRGKAIYGRDGELLFYDDGLPLPGRRVSPRENEGTLSIQNSHDVEWKVYYRGNLLLEGSGSIQGAALPVAKGYILQAESLRGYRKSVRPNPFSIEEGEQTTLEIQYERIEGSLSLDLEAPPNSKMTLIIDALEEKKRARIPLYEKEGRIFWKTSSLPAGKYRVTLDTEGHFLPAEPLLLTVRDQEEHTLSFTLKKPSSITVLNKRDETATLLYKEGRRVGTKQGREVVFDNLDAGEYDLDFASPDKTVTLPERIRCSLSEGERRLIEPTFKEGGSFLLSLNVDSAAVKIERQEAKGMCKEEIYEVSRSRLFPLKEGTYRITFLPLGRKDMFEPDPYEFTLQEGDSLTYEANYVSPIDSAHFGSLRLETLAPQFIASLSKKEGDWFEPCCRLTGKEKTLRRLEEGFYRLDFESVEGFSPPPPVFLEIVKGEQTTYRIPYTPKVELQKVEHQDDQEAISFLIGKYPVTNAQFAAYLNKALLKKEITLSLSGKEFGEVRGLSGRLLFKTAEADPRSQIAVFYNGIDDFSFEALQGKENHPVIFVSYFGASSFCEEEGFRLPKQREWEFAASFGLDEEGKRITHLFGYQSSEPDPLASNFVSKMTKPSKEVRTTAVGFFDGNHEIADSKSHGKKLRTNKGGSFFDVYDMSGNVWEWIFDEGGMRSSIVKGGSFGSSASDTSVQAAARLQKEAVYSDVGFRVAKDSP